MVEDVFAVGVALHIERRAADDRAGRVLDDQVLRQPAGLRIGRPALLQRRQEGVAEERIVGAGARVPVRGGHVRHALDRPDRDLLVAVRHHERPSGPETVLCKGRAAPARSTRPLYAPPLYVLGAVPVQAISNTASISTAKPRGRAGTPTAKRACRPASPSTSTSRSEAPLMTFG